MQRAWTPPVRFVFAAATLLGIFSTLQVYRLATLNINGPMTIVVWRLLVLNLAYWYVPAALTSIIFRIAYRFPLDAPGWPRSLAAHALAAVGLLDRARRRHDRARAPHLARQWLSMTYGSWISSVQRIYLYDLDWALMTYSAIVGLSYALGYYRESRARALRSRPPGSAAGRSAIEDARGRAAPAFSVQHAARDLHAGAHATGCRRSHDQPPERSPADHLLAFRRRVHPAPGGARIPAEVSRDRTDALSGSADAWSSISIPTRSTPRFRG